MDDGGPRDMNSLVDQLTRQAIALHKENRLEEAADLYEAVLRKEPRRFEGRHMLGVVRLQQGRIDEAIALISAALELDPQSADAHCDIGFALRLANRVDEAVSHYNVALSARPRDANMLFDRANALAALG